MSQPEKPRIRDSTPPEVSVEASGHDAIASHRNDIFFAAIETTRMPMLVTDPRQEDNPIIFANRAFLSMSGYRNDEILGHNCRFLQGPGTSRAAVKEIAEAVADRREISIELLNYRKDGSSFWNALYVSPVFNEDKEVVYYFASQLDVSRRRDAEEALGQAQKMEALGQLTGGISHDFNNLLQVMSGHLDILELKSRRGEVDMQAVTRGIENIRSAVSKAATLTQQLLAFSRKQRLEGRPLNLNSVAEGVLELAHRTLGNGVEVRLELQRDLANCQLDPTQLEMSLLNVLVNARDAMPEGGQITIRTENLTVSPDDLSAASGLPPGAYVAISVADNGTGIPPEIVGRVMDPFFTTKDEGKGTGLGLSMVYGFAKQSGGTVDIQSAPGVGTTIRLCFPVTRNVFRSTTEFTRRASDRGGDETVLVVDDRVEVANLSRDMLEGLGYRVMTANSGREAVDLVDALGDQPPPSLLFSDLIMPGGMNGYALARELRRRLPGLKVLLTTGFAGSADGKNSDEGVEFEVIKKPYRLADLARRVRMVLDGPTGNSM
ncbi:histidine kinase famiy protein [Variovorax sp. LT1P1]|uniref:histidine kinase famiy protein n=1 Tax=Variovorax sp. LT1P1 TaxID=3443730 RepID=UPI003F448EA1